MFVVVLLSLVVSCSQDGTFTIHGMADLEDVCTSLAFQEVCNGRGILLLPSIVVVYMLALSLEDK